jgi:hypothetical protein
MKCAVEMGSGAMIFILSFVKYLFRHSKVKRGCIHRHTDRKEIA